METTLFIPNMHEYSFVLEAQDAQQIPKYWHSNNIYNTCLYNSGLIQASLLTGLTSSSIRKYHKLNASEENMSEKLLDYLSL